MNKQQDCLGIRRSGCVVGKNRDFSPVVTDDGVTGDAFDIFLNGVARAPWTNDGIQRAASNFLGGRNHFFYAVAFFRP